VQAGSRESAASGDTLAVDACGECPACRRIARGAYPDVVVIEPEESGSIKIEQIRSAVAQTAYRPFEGRFRLIIVDQADAMGTDAQDALLKSLEEPPPHSVFVLVSSRPDTLLPTVRSRCSRLRFGRLSTAEITRALVANHGYTDADARATAARAGGSLGRALESASGDFDDMRSAACAALRRVAAATDARGRLDGVKELAGGSGAVDRESLAARITVLLAVIRDLAVLSTRAHDDALANLDVTSELQGLSRSYDRDRIVRAFTAADRALSALRRNASPKIVADWLVLQL
jgi:DNA polymerase-3 subunit delta'